MAPEWKKIELLAIGMFISTGGSGNTWDAMDERDRHFWLHIARFAIEHLEHRASAAISTESV